METFKDVVILSGVRTPIGDFGGALRNEPPTRLGALVAAEAIGRAGIAPDQVGHAVFGSVIHTEPRDAYLARVAAVEAGVPVTAPAMTVNRLCGSGLQAIVSAAQMIRLGEVETALAGGAECMSRAGYLLPAARWGQRLGDAAALDMLLGALNDPFGHGHMGITAENVARRHGIDRATQDRLAAESHRRAAVAIAEGRFRGQILPIEVQDGKRSRSFDTDEHVRAETTVESLAGLRPAFLKDGSVTAGNASGINDGAAALVLMEAAAAARQGLTPLARVVAYAHAGVEPSEMGIGPVPAVRRVLERAGLSVSRPRRDRIQRGLRRAGLRRRRRARPAAGAHQPEWRRHRARPSGRRLRRDYRGEADPRAAPHPRPLRPGHHVHRRRPGHRPGGRTALTATGRSTQPSPI